MPDVMPDVMRGAMPGAATARRLPVVLFLVLLLAGVATAAGAGLGLLTGPAGPTPDAAASAAGGNRAAEGAPAALGLPLAAGPMVAPQRIGQLTCPSGTQPEVMISSARFEPRLTRATTLLAGRRYRITLGGTVANNTSAAIRIRTVWVTAGGRPWQVVVRVPALVPPGDSVPLEIIGRLRAPGTEQAYLASTLDWEWAAAALRPCDRGVLPDDD